MDHGTDQQHWECTHTSIGTTTSRSNGGALHFPPSPHLKEVPFSPIFASSSLLFCGFTNHRITILGSEEKLRHPPHPTTPPWAVAPHQIKLPRTPSSPALLTNELQTYPQLSLSQIMTSLQRAWAQLRHTAASVSPQLHYEAGAAPWPHSSGAWGRTPLGCGEVERQRGGHRSLSEPE